MIYNTLYHIQDTKVVVFSIPSDHSAILHCLEFKNPKNNKVFPDDVFDWNILMDKDVKSILNEVLSDEIKDIKFGQQNKLSYSQFSKVIMNPSRKVVLYAKAIYKGWYNLFKDIIQPLDDKRSEVLHFICQIFPSNEDTISLAKEVRRNLREGISLEEKIRPRHLTDKIH